MSDFRTALAGLWRPWRMAFILAISLMLAACAMRTSVNAVGEDLVTTEPRLLTAETFSAWRAHILPGDDDLAYASIPWHVTFGEGMDAARAQGKPLLMWAMNGHPLGCT